MRKLFWGLTAVVVAAAGGMLWVKWQGPTSPYSFAARVAVDGSNNGPGNIIASTISGAATVLGGGSDTAAAGGDEDLAQFQKPDDPTEIVASKEPTIAPATAGVIDFHPQPVAPTINIHEPIEVSRPVGVADSGSWAADFTVGAAAKVDPAIIQVNADAIGLAHGAIQTVPRVMPYAVEDDEVIAMPKMAYAEEEFVPQTPDDDTAPSFWSHIFQSAKDHMCGDGAGHLDAPDYHAHDSYCPFTGRCLPAPKPYVEPMKVTPVPGGDVNSELPPPPKKRTSMKPTHKDLHNVSECGDKVPALTGVDTLEFRPSDHSAYERNSNSI
jgi:hypothetical protein